MNFRLHGLRSIFKTPTHGSAGARLAESDGDRAEAVFRSRRRDEGCEERGPPHRKETVRDETVWIEPFVGSAGTPTSHPAVTRDAARSLERLKRLALEKGRSRTPFAWLREVRSALAELHDRMSDRTARGASFGVQGTGVQHRPDLADQVDQFVEDRRLNSTGLDRLLAEVERSGFDDDSDLTALKLQLAAWLEQRQHLGVRGPELMFRLYWDDIGGEG